MIARRSLVFARAAQRGTRRPLATKRKVGKVRKGAAAKPRPAAATAATAATPKTAPAVRKRARRASTAATDATAALRPVEDVYTRLTPVQHVLLRPDMYVGSTAPVASKQWVLDPASGRMANRVVDHVPGLVKLFDEVLVNAADNRTRSRKTNRIDVVLEPHRVEVRNNGPGIPVELHEGEQMQVRPRRSALLRW